MCINTKRAECIKQQNKKNETKLEKCLKKTTFFCLKNCLNIAYILHYSKTDCAILIILNI